MLKLESVNFFLKRNLAEAQVLPQSVAASYLMILLDDLSPLLCGLGYVFVLIVALRSPLMGNLKYQNPVFVVLLKLNVEIYGLVLREWFFLVMEKGKGMEDG